MNYRALRDSLAAITGGGDQDPFGFLAQLSASYATAETEDNLQDVREI